MFGSTDDNPILRALPTEIRKEPPPPKEPKERKKYARVKNILTRREKEFQSACKQLPPTVDLEEEIEWISAHPAMTRLDRQVDDEEKILIDRNDILNAPHGPAPSRRAVASLQHWVHSPREFQKLILETFKTEKRQSSGTKLEQEGDMMDDLDEAKRLLEHYRRMGK